LSEFEEERAKLEKEEGRKLLSRSVVAVLDSHRAGCRSSIIGSRLERGDVRAGMYVMGGRREGDTRTCFVTPASLLMLDTSDEEISPSPSSAASVIRRSLGGRLVPCDRAFVHTSLSQLDRFDDLGGPGGITVKRSSIEVIGCRGVGNVLVIRDNWWLR